MMCGLPHKFLRKVAKQDLGVDLPEPGRFAAGLVFLPQDEAERLECKGNDRAINLRGGSEINWLEESSTDDRFGRCGSYG